MVPFHQSALQSVGLTSSPAAGRTRNLIRSSLRLNTDMPCLFTVRKNRALLCPYLLPVGLGTGYPITAGSSVMNTPRREIGIPIVQLL